MQPVSRRTLLKGTAAGAFSAVGMGAFADLDSGWIEVVRQDLRLPRWDADGFKIAFLSDVHVNDDEATAKSAAACKIAADEKPDLVVFGGDFVNSSGMRVLPNFGPAFEPLSGLTCPCLAVMGNHDYATQRPADVIAAVERHTPLRLLRNQTVDVRGVTVAGLDDGIFGFSTYTFLKHRPLSKSTLVVLHEPDFGNLVPVPASLMISGHSHGGQICLPFGVAVHTPYGARKYIAGYFPDAPIPLYVNRGIGVTGPLFRLFCRPEVTIFTVRSA